MFVMILKTHHVRVITWISSKLHSDTKFSNRLTYTFFLSEVHRDTEFDSIENHIMTYVKGEKRLLFICNDD